MKTNLSRRRFLKSSVAVASTATAFGFEEKAMACVHYGLQQTTEDQGGFKVAERRFCNRLKRNNLATL